MGRHVALIVAQGGDPPVLAAKSATATIPVVFTISSDPVRLGIVRSLNRPGGNVTGFWPYTSLLGTKRLELMRQLLPANASIAVLVNPDNPNADLDMTELQNAARTLGQSITFVRARERDRNRCGLCDTWRMARLRASHQHRSVLPGAPRSIRFAGGTQ